MSAGTIWSLICAFSKFWYDQESRFPLPHAQHFQSQHWKAPFLCPLSLLKLRWVQLCCFVASALLPSNTANHHTLANVAAPVTASTACFGPLPPFMCFLACFTFQSICTFPFGSTFCFLSDLSLFSFPSLFVSFLPLSLYRGWTYCHVMALPGVALVAICPTSTSTSFQMTFSECISCIFSPQKN